MTEYMTVEEIAEYFGVSSKRAANLMSEHEIRSTRVYPADEVKKINRPGRGARTDLRRQTMMTYSDIRDQVQQATDASEGTYDVDAITRQLVDAHGLVSIEDIDHDEFWSLVLDNATED